MLTHRSRSVRSPSFRTWYTLVSYDLVCICETWLNDTVLSTELIQGYSIFRRDRACKTGGGVLIAVKSDLQPYAVTILACVANVSLWFRSKKDRGRRLSVLTAREMKREQKNERVGRGRGRKERFPSFLPHPLPALLLAPFFARSLTLVPHSLLLNRTKTLATQAMTILKETTPKW